MSKVRVIKKDFSAMTPAEKAKACVGIIKGSADSEKSIETYLKDAVEKELKGKCIKINSMSMNGLPDRMVLLPEGFIFFVELKTDGAKLRPLQVAAHRMLTYLGNKVYTIDSKIHVQELIRRWKLLYHTNIRNTQ